MIEMKRDRHIDERAVLAAENEEIMEQLIDSERPYILSCAGKTLLRHVNPGSEEELVALEAFVEAVKSYSFEKGSFLSFARLVISRRLIDDLRREKALAHMVPMDPADITLTKDKNEAEHFWEAQESSSEIVCEIERLSEALSEYGFSFIELTTCSPKAMKTKAACREAVSYVLENQVVVSEIHRKRQLPIKIIEKNAKVPRKILERHRKYIIAVVIILTGDYLYLKEYIDINFQ